MAGGYHSDQTYVNSLGYTANFGGGFSATVTLDDATDRHNWAAGPARAGHVLPDITGALVYDQSWGTVRIAGAIGQMMSATNAFSTKYGYAVEGGVKINLPMLTKGSNIWVSGSYAKGMVNYAGYGVFGATTIASVSYSPVDATAAGLQSTAYGITGALQVYATPTVAVSVGAAYGVYNPAGVNNSVKGLTVLGQVAWMPVAGFLIGAEAAYRTVSYDAGAAVTLNGTKKNDIVGRIRFQRDF